MPTQCSANTVDKNAARVVAAIVVVLSALSLWPPLTSLMAVLAVDFVIRGFVDRRHSPLRWAAKSIVAGLGLEAKPVYAPPKRFAAQIGSVLALTATVLHVVGAHGAAVVVTVALMTAATLEAALGVCIACWIYPLVHRLRGEAGT